MRKVLFLITIIVSSASQAQNLTLNEDFIYENLRLEQLRGNLKTNILKKKLIVLQEKQVKQQ